MTTLTWRHLSPDLDLHAPGLPDRLLTDGVHLGWQDSGGLYVELPDGGGVAFLALPDIVDLVATGPDRWVAVTSAPSVCWGAPGAPWQQRTLSPGRWRAGGTWLHGRRGLGHRTETVEEGTPVPSPPGATRALPLPDQAGLVWASSTALCLLDGAGRVRVIDALPSACVSLLPGPEGTVLVETRDEGVAASVGGRLLVRLPEALSLEGGRISPDGRRALLPVEEGAGLFDLRTGSLLEQWPEVSPVGIQQDRRALLLDDTHGTVQDSRDGAILRGGFLPAAPLRVEGRLYGPGGAAWDLAAGEALFEAPELSAEALLFDDESGEALVFALQESSVVILDAETGEVLGEEPREDDGADLSPVEADLLSDEDAAALGEGLPVDCGVEVGGRWWLWSGEGLLVSRRSPR